MKIGYILIAIFGIVILTWVWKTLNWVWFNPKKMEKCLRKQGLKGNSYKFLYGDLKETFRMRQEAREKPIPFTHDYVDRVLPFLQQHIKKYGENFWTWLGPIPDINIAEPALIRDAFTRMNEFQKAKLNPLVGLLVPGLVGYEGENWAKHRKLINPAFHMEKLKLMLPAFGDSVIEMVSEWEKLVSEIGSSEVDVWPFLTSLSADVISRAAFGSSYKEGRRIFELLKEQTQITIRLFQSVYIPGWRYVPTKTNRKMKQINSDIQNLLMGIINKRKKAMEAGEAPKDDLLGILMDSNSKASQTQSVGSQKQQQAMSLQDMIDECKLFYFAGQETTSVLLVWTMILLSKHQDWQTRAREEVQATFGKNQPDFDGLNHLKIVTMILHEVLRLYPPVTSTSRRIYQGDMKLGNILVPRGAMISLSIINTHRDPRLWGDDANEFKPERFSEGIAKATKGNISFFPFGWGPRICIGQNFAIAEAKMALSMILQRFTFELSPSYTHAPSTVITLQPQHGAHVILHRLEGCE
ncbi:cytochrome P450 72A15-like [Chenopodium quinoa]|uniref:Cytochrome P450 n=1 Tax=Chenopodium quinoa TaxID=63459 RepID=A0A803LW40_CHEQI|nr:cytochrome P450 72A15-like [Chenopodium quinoa]